MGGGALMRHEGFNPQELANTAWASATLGMREEGFRSLYKGFAPKVLRMAAGGAIGMVLRYSHWAELKGEASLFRSKRLPQAHSHRCCPQNRATVWSPQNRSVDPFVCAIRSEPARIA